ncbi:MAG: TonB-dependent receptor [Opitutaceae bacterium]|nr:TonB-dependent receptor [Opitutaceae bacterium]
MIPYTPRASIRALVAAVFVSLFVASASAQTATPGAIEGRVSNARTGEYLGNARITIDGTALETFTDSSGGYRLNNVPPGNVRLTAFFTGLSPLTQAITVASGQTVERDIELSLTEAKPGAAADPSVVKLSEFVVSTSREMEGAAVAINEQRFAANMKEVVSTEEFGNVAEGNPAEFLKFLPGISIDYTGGNARDISINGVPSDYVPVTVDGFGVATAANLGTGRAVQSDMISINNLSRIEVSYSPTPDSEGSALAGSVNMVPRSAFERSRPQFNGSAYIMMRDNARDFKKVPGPKPSPTRNVHPGLDFSYVAPVNKRFGYTVSGGYSTNYSPQDQIQLNWIGAGAQSNGNAFPHTTPDRPYLTTFQVQDAPKVTTRRSFGATVDYKLTPHDRVTLAFQYSSFDGRFVIERLTFNTVRVPAGNFGPDFTHGQTGSGNVENVHNERNRFNRTYMPTFVWRHEGPVWKGDLGLGLSQQGDYNRDAEQGFLRAVTTRRTGVTVSFDDLFYLRPRTITVTDAAGTPVDYSQLSNFSVVSASSQRDATHDYKRTAYGSIRRNFYTAAPFTLKAGFNLRQNVRDMRDYTFNYNYVGADGRGSTTPVGNDDSAAPFLDPIFSERIMPYGFGKVQGVSARKMWEDYNAHPSHWTINQNTSYQSQVNNSKYAEEIVSALYLRGDVSLLNRRLKLVGGVRAEQTNVNAQGPLTDPTRNIQRDSQGRPILGSDGQPLPITTNAFEVSQLTLIDRGTRTEKEYLRYFPSLNASFNVTENTIVRAAYSTSVGRPNFNQYAGALTLPDTTEPTGPGNRIVVNNAGIKAWSSETVNLRLEHYFPGVGQISFTAFRRWFDNFHGNTIFDATPEFLTLYGLDPTTYDAYEVSTQHNIPGTVRLEGLQFNYKQSLTFLPRWARGVHVFANASSQRAIADESANFSGYVPRTASWGISLTRERWNVRTNWNYRGRQRRNPINGNSIEPGTFNWGSKRLYVDVLGEFYFYKRFAVYANLRNVGDATEDIERHGPSTPAHAQFRQRIDYASLWTFGVKGTW